MEMLIQLIFLKNHANFKVNENFFNWICTDSALSPGKIK